LVHVSRNPAVACSADVAEPDEGDCGPNGWDSCGNCIDYGPACDLPPDP
jgi:hypothetical protein